MGWFRQQLMYKTSSDEMLAKQAQFAKKPSKRVAAYYGLASRRSDKCFDVLLNKLTDKDSLWISWGDLWGKATVSELMLNISFEDSLLFTKEQTFTIDSAIVFGSGLEHLDKSGSASRLFGYDGLYERIRELYLSGDSNLLPILADYKNPGDIPLIVDALREYRLFDYGEYHTYILGRTDDALAAVMNWPNDAFVPILEELKDSCLFQGYSYYYREMLFYKAVMAYDNDWAYVLIEDLFENKEIYSLRDDEGEVLYRAYSKEKEKPRFLPLIEKFGKKPIWESFD